MSKFLRLIAVITVVLFLFSGLSFVGCTRYANEEQLKTLDETKEAALSAEKKAAEKEEEKANAEKKLVAKKDELKKLKEEKEAVKKRLEEMSVE